MIAALDTAQRMRDLVVEASRPEHRARRVLWLVIAVAIMSAGDLYMTLTHAMGPGFLESNPVARLVMSTGSPWILGLYKLCTAGPALLILWLYRHRRVAELGAWLGLCMLLWLTLQWAMYSEAVTDIGTFGPWLSAEHAGVEFVAMARP